jgi:glycosyltransferase involved in cell wall biosynthesis
MGHRVTIVSPPGVNPLSPVSSAPVDKSNVKTRGIQTLWKWISKHLPNAIFELMEIAYNLPAYFRLRRVLAAGSFDLIYERYAFYLVAGSILARSFNIPLVLEANEVSGISNRARPQSFPHLCARFERFLFRRCTAIHTVSSKLRDMICAQDVPPSRIHVVPNALDVDKVLPRSKPDNLVARYKLDGTLVLGFAGWFDEWDRLDFLIDVFARLYQRYPNLRVLLIGDGRVVADLKRRIGSYRLDEAVIFTGPVPRAQIYDYLSLIDIAVLPHSNDFGSPVVMFEFMGLKIPVVAPRLPPIEDVHTDQQTAMLFAPLNAKECGTAIEKLVLTSPLRESIAAEAYQLLRTRHTWARNASLILESAALA